jgi:hypothetical protein
MSKNQNIVLCEKITLLRRKEKFTSTTDSIYDEVLHTRAAIKHLGINDGEHLLEVIMRKPPPRVSKMPLAALRWNDDCYVLRSLLKDHGSMRMTGIFSKPIHTKYEGQA